MGTGACRVCLRGLPSGSDFDRGITESGMRSFALLEHKGNARTLLHRFKINASHETTGIFKLLMRRWYKKLRTRIDPTLLVPIPSHRKGPADPGSASYRAAHLLSAVTGIPVHSILYRTQTLAKQSSSDRRLRLAAPAGTLAVNPPGSRPPSDRPQKVLLVDDVRTTGATAREAACRLLQAGYAAVDLFTLSRPKDLTRSLIRIRI